jgi:hypothetical protein
LSGLSTASIEDPDRFARLVGRVKALNKSESPTFFFLSIYTILSGSGSWTLATDLIVRLDPDTWAISVIKDFGVTGRFSRLNIELREFQNTSFTFEEVSPHEVILVKQSKDADQVIKQCFRVSDSSVSSLDCLIAEKNRNFKPLLRPFDEFLKPMLNPVN